MAKNEQRRLEEKLEQTVQADKSKAENLVWGFIKDSDNPELFKVYLKEYPDGEFVIVAEAKIKELVSSVPAIGPSGPADIPNLEYGDYYALVIGNNRYENFRDLRTAVNDARTISRLLEDDYGFSVKLLEDVTRSEILSSIKNLRKEVGRHDNVLIYYAGHGELNRETDEGFWIPVDADREDESNWLLIDRVRSQIKAMPAKHVMVMADSCFSGKLTRSAIMRGLEIKRTSPEYVPSLQRLIDKKSRRVLTSGGEEPVLDSGSGGKHSVFAEALISILESNDRVLEATELFSKLRPKVMNNSSQTPEYSTIHEAGDDGGDFLFVKR